LKVLYITIASPTSNFVASQRTLGFMKYFPQNGIEIDVLTRYFDDKQALGLNFQVATQPPENFSLPFVVKDNIVFTNFDNNHWLQLIFKYSNWFFKKIIYYCVADIAHLGWKKHAINAYKKVLLNKKYDFIIASYGPLVTFQIASEISKISKIPWIADYRDLHIETFKYKFQRKILQWHENKILSQAIAYTVICDAIASNMAENINSKILNKPYSTILNAFDTEYEIQDYDEKVYKKIIENTKKYKYKFLHAGSLYEGRNINYFFQIIETYNKTTVEKICLILIGPKFKFNKIPDFVFIETQVSFDTSLKLQSWADALIYPIWEGRYTGFTSKIFDYLYSNNNILIGPSVQKDLHDYLDKFNNVYYLNGDADFINIMANIENLPIKNNSNIELLSKSYWVKEFSTFLYQLKNKTNTKT
jgi:hypothetical protein